MHVQPKRALPALAFLGVLVACDDGSDSTTRALASSQPGSGPPAEGRDASPGSGMDGGAVEATARDFADAHRGSRVQRDTEGQASLSGRYAVVGSYVQRQTLDVGLGVRGVLRNTTRATSLVEIDPDGRYVEQSCAIEIDSQDGDGNSALFVSKVEINPDVFARLPRFERQIVSDGERWELPFASRPLGFRPDDPSDVDAPLPTSADDPRMFDEDGDGAPGLTIRLRDNAFASGDLYVARWQQGSALGHVEDGRLVGELVARDVQSIVGGTGPMAEETLEPAGDAQTNRIVMVRIADDLDCEGLLAEGDALFAR